MRAPLGAIEQQRRKVRGADFRLGECGQALRLRLVPKAIADAGFGAPGASTALIGTGARDTHGFEPRDADVGLEARHAR